MSVGIDVKQNQVSLKLTALEYLGLVIQAQFMRQVGLLGTIFHYCVSSLVVLLGWGQIDVAKSCIVSFWPPFNFS